MQTYEVTKLPFDDIEALETRAVLKKLSSAHRYLAELKGVVSSIPNEAILINMTHAVKSVEPNLGDFNYAA